MKRSKVIVQIFTTMLVTLLKYPMFFAMQLTCLLKLSKFGLDIIKMCNSKPLFLSRTGSFCLRISISIIVELIVFSLTIALAMVDSSSWPITFFIITLISVVILNMANGVYQNSIYGAAAKLPMKYSNAIVLGTKHQRNNYLNSEHRYHCPNSKCPNGRNILLSNRLNHPLNMLRHLFRSPAIGKLGIHLKNHQQLISNSSHSIVIMPNQSET